MLANELNYCLSCPSDKVTTSIYSTCAQLYNLLRNDNRWEQPMYSQLTPVLHNALWTITWFTAKRQLSFSHATFKVISYFKWLWCSQPLVNKTCLYIPHVAVRYSPNEIKLQYVFQNYKSCTNSWLYYLSMHVARIVTQEWRAVINVSDHTYECSLDTQTIPFITYRCFRFSKNLQ